MGWKTKRYSLFSSINAFSLNGFHLNQIASNWSALRKGAGGGGGTKIDG